MSNSSKLTVSAAQPAPERSSPVESSDDRQLSRWGGLAGLAGVVLMLGTFVVVGVLALPDASDVRVQMELNGEIVQDSTTAQLIFDIPTTIAHLSQFITLKPGDVIYTGTPPGVGDAKDPPVYLKPGDRCCVIIGGIGTLTNICQ